MAGPPNELVLHGYSPGGDWGAGDKTVPGFLVKSAFSFLNPASMNVGESLDLKFHSRECCIGQRRYVAGLRAGCVADHLFSYACQKQRPRSCVLARTGARSARAYTAHAGDESSPRAGAAVGRVGP